MLPLERRAVLPLTDGLRSLTLQNGDRVDRTFGLDAIVTVSCERLFLYITLGSRDRLCVLRSTYHSILFLNRTSVFAVDIGARVLESFEFFRLRECVERFMLTM